MRRFENPLLRLEGCTTAGDRELLEVHLMPATKYQGFQTYLCCTDCLQLLKLFADNNNVFTSDMDEFDDLQYRWEEGGREELCAPLPGLLDHSHHHGDGED